MTARAHRLENTPCPKCGAVMEFGYIAGQYSRLRWTKKEKTFTIFAGEPIRKTRSWFHAPTIEATKCTNCGIGMFVFEN